MNATSKTSIGHGLPSGRRRRRPFWLFATMLLVAGCATSAPQGEDDAARAATQAQAQEANLTAAEADIAARRFKLAFQRLARLDPATAETSRARYVMAEVLLGMDRPHEALARFEAVQSDPAFQALALQGMGLAQLASGDTVAAKAQLEGAVATDPNLWRAWAGLGRVHDQEKRWDDAAAAYERGLAASPDSPIIRNNMGMSLLLQHRYAEAAGAFERAIAKDPTMATARANLRIALAWQGRYAEASAGLQSADRADALNNIGYVAMLRGDRQVAQRYFSQAMEASPTYHPGAAGNLETLKLLAKTNPAGTLPQTADTPMP